MIQKKIPENKGSVYKKNENSKNPIKEPLLTYLYKK